MGKFFLSVLIGIVAMLLVNEESQTGLRDAVAGIDSTAMGAEMR